MREVCGECNPVAPSGQQISSRTSGSGLERTWHVPRNFSTAATASWSETTSEKTGCSRNSFRASAATVFTPRALATLAGE